MAIDDRLAYHVYVRPVPGTEQADLVAKYVGISGKIAPRSVGDESTIGYMTSKYIIYMGNDIPGDQKSKYVLAEVIESLIVAYNNVSLGANSFIVPMIQLTQLPIHKTYYNLETDDPKKDDPFKEDDMVEQLSDYLEGNF